MEILVKIKKRFFKLTIINFFMLIVACGITSLVLIFLDDFKEEKFESPFLIATLILTLIFVSLYIANFILSMMIYKNVISNNFLYEKWYMISCFLSTFFLGFFTSIINTFLTISVIKKLKVKKGEIDNFIV